MGAVTALLHADRDHSIAGMATGWIFGRCKGYGWSTSMAGFISRILGWPLVQRMVPANERSYLVYLAMYMMLRGP